MFFCKYNDPIYVKMEKLEIMIRLVSERNVDQVQLPWRLMSVLASTRYSCLCVERARAHTSVSRARPVGVAAVAAERLVALKPCPRSWLAAPPAARR